MEQNISYWQILKKLFPFLGMYKKIVISSFLLTILTSIIAQITPLLVQYITNKVSYLVTNKLSICEALTILIIPLLILLGKEVVNLVATVFQRYIGDKLKVFITIDLIKAAFSNVLYLDLDFFNHPNNDEGKLIKRIDTGPHVLGKTVKSLFTDLLPLIGKASIALVVMYSVNVWVGLVSTIIIPIYLFLSIRQSKKQKGIRISLQNQIEKRLSEIYEAISSIKLVKSFIKEKYEIHKNLDLTNQIATKEIQHHFTNHFYDGFKYFFEQIGLILVIFVTAILILNGQMTVGAIALNILLYNNIVSPIKELNRIYDEANEAIIFANSFFKLLEEKPSLKDGSIENSNKFESNIQFLNVSFSYNGSKQILKNIDFEIKENQTVALIGLSGAGKTTLANLIGRFYDVSSGEIVLNGRNIKDYKLNFLRENIGYVMQQNHIFNGTIYENIVYGINLESNKIPIAQVIEASQKADIHNEIIELKDGYETSAKTLSGGQKQRIALARIFLKEPKLLILDEPTASLDAISANKIKESIDKAKGGRTVLIISHNLASIIDADKIYVLKDGKIVGEGNHKSLYDSNDHYRDLIDANIKAMNVDKLISVRD